MYGAAHHSCSAHHLTPLWVHFTGLDYNRPLLRGAPLPPTSFRTTTMNQEGLAMMKINSIKVLGTSSFIAIGASLGIATDTSTALAANSSPATCVPNLMEYSTEGAPGAAAGETLIVQCSAENPANFYGLQNTPSGCTIPSQPTDTLKVWASEAQAAILAGHNINIYWAACGTPSVQVIQAIDLLNH
jgi:hypothetical protein